MARLNALKKYREWRGLSLRKCASELGIELRSQYRLEQGHGCTAVTAAKVILNSHAQIALSDLLPKEHRKLAQKLKGIGL
jgi:predicted transcriptional regulator